MNNKTVKKKYKQLLSETNESAFDEIKNLEKQIKMERRKKAWLLVKQLAIVSLLFVVYTEVLKVDNWILALIYAVGTIFVFGLITFTYKVIKYVKEKRARENKN